MDADVVKELYRPDDLLHLPDGERYELVDGVLKERAMSSLSSYVAGQLLSAVNAYCQQRNAGWVFASQAGYVCFPNRPRLVRYPDVSFIRRGRLPGEELPTGHCRIPPDLAVEVVSSNDIAQEHDEKLQEYLGAGVSLVWVIYPQTRTVHVFRPDGFACWLRADQELTGDPVLPGFRCRVGELFPPPVAPGANGSHGPS
jgi:Uma2 family endonuclease